MSRKLKVCAIEGTFHDLYFWGQGYKDHETAEKWNEFWNAFEPKPFSSWKYVPSGRSGVCGNLVSDHCVIYLHPMDFRACVYSCGVSMPRGNDDNLEDYFGETLDELKKICDEVAEKCGGSFTLKAQYSEITLDDMREW